MFIYDAYGLTIHSALALPELALADEAAPDVVIQLQPVERRPAPIDRTGGAFDLNPHEAYLHWGNVGAFLVRNGNEILIDPLPGVEERLIRLPLLGVVIAVLLHQRSQLVLHASAVAIDGQAVIFLGQKRQGKSTLAATLYGRGHTMLADDIVAVRADDGQHPHVLPGFPQFKLWPEAAASSLGDDPATLPVLATGTDKRARGLTERFARQTLALGGIYVLETGPDMDITPLPPQAALVQLMTHTYVVRFSKDLLRGERAANHMRQCAQLVRQVPIYTLTRPRELALLPDAAQLIETTLAAPSDTAAAQISLAS